MSQQLIRAFRRGTWCTRAQATELSRLMLRRMDALVSGAKQSDLRDAARETSALLYRVRNK